MLVSLSRAVRACPLLQGTAGLQGTEVKRFTDGSPGEEGDQLIAAPWDVLAVTGHSAQSWWAWAEWALTQL